MDIEKIVKKYNSRNPFRIAKEMNIKVIFEPLGDINGYFTTVLREKQIHINSDIPEQKQLFTAAHELGHALLHPKENTPFLRGSTFFSVSKLENEANRFAIYLLISDEDLIEFRDRTIVQMASTYGVDYRIMELRFK